jgi:uncharacterized protein (DUF4415 family)
VLNSDPDPAAGRSCTFFGDLFSLLSYDRYIYYLLLIQFVWEVTELFLPDVQQKLRRKGIMLITKKLDLNKPPEFTEEEIAMLEALKDRPVIPDEDCPELTEEQLDEMVEERRIRLALQRKQVVSVRLSNRALEKAKSFGKGYTSVLSQILERVLTDTSILKQLV